MIRFKFKALLFLSIATVGSCKRVGTATRLSDQLGSNAACFPQLHSLAFKAWKHDSQNTTVEGFFDENTIREASYLWNMVIGNDTELTNIKSHVAVGWEHHGRRDRIKRWLIVAADKQLIIRDQRLNRTFTIPDLVVQNMWMSRDSQFVAMITGEESEEFLQINLQQMGITGVVGDPLSPLQHFQNVMAKRSREISKSSSKFKSGFAHQLPSLTRIFRQKEYNGDASAKFIDDVISVSWFNDPRGDGYQDFPWPAANLEGYFVMIGPKGVTEQTGQRPQYGPGSAGDSQGLQSATAFGQNFKRGLIGGRHWFTAQRKCDSGYDNKQSCQISILAHTSGKSPTFVHSFKEDFARNQFPIHALAVGPRTERRQLIAYATGVNPNANDDGSFLKLLEWNLDSGKSRVLRTFTLGQKVKKMRFAIDDLKNPSSHDLGKLYIESGTSPSAKEHHTIDLDAILRPIMVGQHGRSKPLAQDWRLTGVKESLAVWRQQSPSYLSRTWDQLATPPSGQIYGLSFDGSSGCESLVSGGLDGKTKLWNLKTVGQSRTQSLELRTSNEPSALVGLELNKDSSILTASYANGAVTAWSMNRLQGDPISEFPTKMKYLTAAGTTSSGDRFIATGLGQAPSFFDQQGQPANQSLDEVSETRLLNHNGNAASITAMAAWPSQTGIQHMHVFANNFGTIMSSNIQQASGGEVHQIQFSDQSPGFVATKVTTNQDGSWIVVAGTPEPGGSTGTLRRYQSKARFDANRTRYDHCQGPAGNTNPLESHIPYEGHVGSVMDVAMVSQNGPERLVSVGLDGRLIVWSMLDPCKPNAQSSQEDAKILASFSTISPLTSVAVTKDGAFAAAGTIDGRVLLFWLEDNINLY